MVGRRFPGVADMSETSPKLSNIARTVLTLAAARDDHLVRFPQLPVAAARQVVRSLLSAGLVEEIPAPIEDADFTWRNGEDGEALMLRVTAAGLTRIGEPETASVTVVDAEGADAPVNDAPISEGSDTLPPPTPVPAGQESADIATEGEPNEGIPTTTIQVDAGIVPFVIAFVQELMKPERPPCVAAFLRRLHGGAARGTVSRGTKRAREMSVSPRKIVELCSRLEGATGKELAEGCGWPSIAARATCQKIADRFGYVLHKNPKANRRGFSFRLTAKPPVDI